MNKKKVRMQNGITYAIVAGCWILIQILDKTGHLTSLLKGILVPLCMYSILAVSLNLTVGILGELSLGHAGFMCVGAFAGAFFTKCMENVLPNLQVRFFLAISAALAGVAGVLYAHNLSTLAATPKNFGYNMSIMILVFVVLGGLGNIRGSMIAAVVLTLLPELLRGLNDYRMLIYAVVLIVMMLFNSSPKAIELRSVLMDKLKKQKGAGAKEAA